MNAASPAEPDHGAAVRVIVFKLGPVNESSLATVGHNRRPSEGVPNKSFALVEIAAYSPLQQNSVSDKRT